MAGLPAFPSDEVFESFSARALEKLGHPAAVPRDQQQHPIRFSENGVYPPRPLYEVFDPKLWHANYGDGSFFKDKIVIVGPSAQVFHDFVPTPMEPDTLGPVFCICRVISAAPSLRESLHNTSEITNLILDRGCRAAGLDCYCARPAILHLFCWRYSG